ncbi:DUF2764 family protein [Methylococcus sp. EFPC2]|uniref:DUF2764 family protein n=1 Tax=Methylococcus sp. EFPC2 TaxID=2812648 RepID=UPI0019681D58|nr:DUF2764 family protein [Methylococcus sp. EFPC2]QSA97820.1 DUF2764 family protein [Methylococcus sp. EFPC2]
MAAAYYTLIGSLPHLPRLDQAERLPISRLKLEQRLRMLETEDAEQLARAETLAAWQMTLSKPKTDADMVARYQEAMHSMQPVLRDFLEFRFGLQTLVAALRRRQVGAPAPARGEAWGTGPWLPTIVRLWNEPDFGLAKVHPWLPEARGYLERQDALALERQLMTVVWNWLSRTAESNAFGYEAVVAYVFRWDLLRAWLARSPAAAKTRFQALIKEVTDVS